MTCNFIPQSLADVRELAKMFAASGIVSDDDKADAAKRAAAYGCTIAEALQADLMIKIMAGAARDIDPATSLMYFAVYGGAVRAVREGPLALVQRSGKLEEIDERVITEVSIKALEYIDTGREDVDADELESLRANWAAESNNEGKYRALQVRAVERLRQLEQTRKSWVGYVAAVCAVRRAGRWHVKISDIDHAEARGLLSTDSDYWQRFRETALMYAARQPLLRETFADVIGGLADDDAPRGGTSTIPAAPPSGSQDSDDAEDLRAGVTAA